MADAQELRAALSALRTSAAALTTAVAQAGQLQRIEADQINWRDVMQILDDVLISVSREGQFRSGKVRQALPLIELALAVLAASAGEAERRLDSAHITWFDQILMYLPGASGDRARMVIASYQRDTRGLERLTKLLEDVKTHRVAIAAAIDEAVETHLLDTNEVYRKLHEERQNSEADAARAARINRNKSNDAHSLDQAVDFYRQHGCIPELPVKDDAKNQNPSVLSTGLERFQQVCEAKARIAMTRMEAMRDAFKAEIYGGSEE